MALDLETFPKEEWVRVVPFAKTPDNEWTSG